MSDINWLDMLGWGEDEIEDLRFVGYSYIKQGHYETALPFFEALVILSKEAEYDLQTLGALHLQLGNNLSALNYLEKSLKKNPNHSSTLINKVKALYLLGYKRQADMQSVRLEEESPDEKVRDQVSALRQAYS